MPRRLVVLIGAGASHDCASDDARGLDPSHRPPLVKDLFSRKFDEILGLYPLAQAAAPDIRGVVAAEGENALPLEQYLREQMRDSDSEFTQRRYRQIPLYLQDVMFTVATRTGASATRPNRTTTTLS